MNRFKKPLLMLLQLSLVITCRSQPNFLQSFQLNEISFYQDYQVPKLFYYLPESLEMYRKSDGSPDLNFIMMRYAGSAINTNAETQPIRYLNQLTMKIHMKLPHPDSLSVAKRALSAKHGNVQIVPLPLSNIDAMLVYTPINSASDQDTVFVKKGEMASRDNLEGTGPGNYWNEKYFTIFPDNHSAMLLHDAWKKKSAVISFTYVLYAKGISEHRVLESSGFGTLAEKLKNSINVTENNAVENKECIVQTSSWSILPDLARYPNLVKIVDVNDAIPKGYAMLNIRNYDFANQLRPELYEKTVELQAIGAGGDPVNCSVTFSQARAHISSVNYSFPYAIRPEFPYQYRVIELFNDGHEVISEWKTINIWSGLLDVTTISSNH